MTKEGIKNYMMNSWPSFQADEAGEWLNVQIEAPAWKEVARQLRSSELNLDYLFCLTCVDWKTHLSMVYHLSSTIHRQTLVIKAKLDRDKPEIDTVSDIWKTADFHEREVSEMFGVQFNGHPDLRKLILTDDFVGYPMRKDFEDPVNMIRL